MNIMIISIIDHVLVISLLSDEQSDTLKLVVLQYKSQIYAIYIDMKKSNEAFDKMGAMN